MAGIFPFKIPDELQPQYIQQEEEEEKERKAAAEKFKKGMDLLEGGQDVVRQSRSGTTCNMSVTESREDYLARAKALTLIEHTTEKYF